MATGNGSGRYDAVTFDMGFTLVNMHSGFDSLLLEIAHREGLTVTLEEVQRALDAFWRGWVAGDATRQWEPSVAADAAMSYTMDRTICESLGIRDPRVITEVWERAEARFRGKSSYSIFPDVIETLEAVRARVRSMGIVSNWGWFLPELCHDLGLAERFDFIVTSARVGATKPHPAIFRAALEHAGATPDRVLHVGDNVRADIAGAQAMGITAVLIDRSGETPAGDHPTVRTLSEVVSFL